MKRARFSTLFLSCSLFFIFAAFNGAQAVESSLHSGDPQLGFWTVGIVQLGTALFSLSAPFVVKRLGTKVSLVFGALTQVLFMVANIRPERRFLFPAAGLLGFGSSVLLTAQGGYLATLARVEVQATGGSLDELLGELTALYFTFFQLNSLAGNLVSSVILGRPGGGADSRMLFYVFAASACLGALALLFLPQATRPASTAAADGEGVLNAQESAKDSLLEHEPPPKAEGEGANPYLSIGSSSALYLSLPSSSLPSSSLTEVFRALSDPSLLLLLPCLLNCGLALGFLVGTFNGGVTGASLGVSKVGYVMVAASLTDSLCSFGVPRVTAHFSRAFALLVGYSAHMSFAVILLFWRGDPDHLHQQGYHATTALTAKIVALICLFAMGNSMNNSQLNTFMGLLFPKVVNGAYAVFTFASAIGFATILMIAPYTSFETRTKIFIASQSTAVASFIVLVWRERRGKNRAEARL